MRDSDQFLGLALFDRGPPDQGNDFAEIFKTDDGSVPERTHVNQHKKGGGEK